MATVPAVYIRNTGNKRIGDVEDMSDTNAAALAARQRVGISTRNGTADAIAVAAKIPSEHSLTKIASIAFTPSTIPVLVDASAEFTVAATTEAGTTIQLNNLDHINLTDGEEFATLGAMGGVLSVTGVATGTATLTASYGGQTATATVAVSAD